ncbi:MAG: diguanylate cyclase, partial [Blastocatellia bacterium]|nr:diguanylate cyclase [Blastocatellia bacterium]
MSNVWALSLAGASLIFLVMVAAVDRSGFYVLISALIMAGVFLIAHRSYVKRVEASQKAVTESSRYAHALEERTAALRDSEQRFRSAFKYAPIGIALVSPDGRWVKVNKALCDILGYTAQEFLSMHVSKVIFPDDLAQTLASIDDLVTGRAVNCQMEQRYIHKSGWTVWASWSASAASEAWSEAPHLIFQIQDTTDRKVAEEQLQHEATHDALTGLPNRAYFVSRLTKALAKAKRDPKYSVSVLFIDLDRFKYVNDSLGHFIGDNLLMAIADRLGECMRPPDIIARLGGDEFTILVEGRYYTEKASRIAERIQEKFSEPFQVHGHEIYSSASIGILVASDRYDSAEDIMRDADTAMYYAKRAGRARHETFDEYMHLRAKETLRLETDLRRAL